MKIFEDDLEVSLSSAGEIMLQQILCHGFRKNIGIFKTVKGLSSPAID
jgi:hypothetical protein